jgi:hypothetical protein
MPLIELDANFDDETPLPNDIERWLDASRQRIQLYWDRFREKPLPQYIECDFDWVARGMMHCIKQGLLDGKLFVEWGCGFGVVTGIASLLGLEAVGIEAEPFLCEEANKLLQTHGVAAEIWNGNFLPRGARSLAENTDPLVSLTHHCPSAYEQNQMSLDDFAFIYGYPWPGEEHFLRCVFERFARRDAIMIMYRGPFQLELYRKT